MMKFLVKYGIHAKGISVEETELTKVKDMINMFCTNLNNHVPLTIPVNYCTSFDSSQKDLVYSIETHIKI
jgi:hypothetical protein